MTVRGYETYDATIDGQTVPLHRCTECLRIVWQATGTVQDDNGYTPACRPLVHLRKCPHYRDGRLPSKGKSGI